MQDNATKEGTTRTSPSSVYWSRPSFHIADQMDFEPKDNDYSKEKTMLRTQPLSAPMEIRRGFHQAQIQLHAADLEA
jgi:hypothetical protein